MNIRIKFSLWRQFKLHCRLWFAAVCAVSIAYFPQLLLGQGLPTPGSVDATFAAKGPGVFILVQSDGHLLTAGGFSIRRFDSDGSYDSTFAITSGSVWPYITSMALQPDGKVLFAEQDREYARLIRLNTNGSVDSSFAGLQLPDDPHYGDFWLSAFLFQRDGKLVGFGYRLYEDYWDDDIHWESTALYRWQPNGDIDGSFVPYSPHDGNMQTLALQTNNQILVAGTELILLNTNGTRDTNFVAGPFSPIVDAEYPADGAFIYTIQCCAIQPDGCLLVGGYFTNVQGQARSHVARLLPDGRLDTSFNPPIIEGSCEIVVNTLAVQTDGRILVGGIFDTLDGLPYGSLGRLNADGTLDTTFNPVQGIRQEGDDDGIVNAIVIQDETRALVGGRFSDTFDGDLCRIHLGEPAPHLTMRKMSGDTLQLNFSYFGTNEFNLLATTNFSLPLSNWSVLGSATDMGSGRYQFTAPDATNHSQRFYRLRWP